MNSNKNRSYKIIRNSIKKLLPYQIGTFTLSLTTIIMSVIIINHLQSLIDMLQNGNYNYNIYFKLIGSCIIYVIFMILFQFIFKRTQITGANEVTILLYNRVQEKPLQFFKQIKSGEIISLINNEGKAVGDWLSSGLLILLNEFSVLLLNIGMMLYYNITLTLLLSIIMFIFFISTKILAMKMAKLSSDSLKITGKMNSFILETLKSETLINILNKKSLFKNKFSAIVYNDKYPIDYKKANYSACYMTIFALLSVLLPIISVIIGAYMMSKQNMSIGTLLAFYALTMQIQEPVRYIPEFLSQRKNTMALAENLYPIVKEVYASDISNIILPNKIDSLYVDIEYFSYENSEVSLLNGVNFELSSKDILLIKGNSGVGKSTLLELIMGFISSNTVKIVQNNINCSNVSKDELWKHTLIVSQEMLLLDGSLKENLLLGEIYPSDLLDEVIFTTCLESYVNENGIDTIINNSDELVSGGQKQRISIARILLRKPDILILDEPTSALDSQTSMELSKRITLFIKKNNMILIVVSHKNDFDNYATKLLKI
ncbi:MAG: ABC transporter transmembrane domain-containing protein [Clostridium sp.]